MLYLFVVLSVIAELLVLSRGTLRFIRVVFFRVKMRRRLRNVRVVLAHMSRIL